MTEKKNRSAQNVTDVSFFVVGGAVRLVLDRSELEEVQLHQPCCQMLPLLVYEGT